MLPKYAVLPLDVEDGTEPPPTTTTTTRKRRSNQCAKLKTRDIDTATSSESFVHQKQKPETMNQDSHHVITACVVVPEFTQSSSEPPNATPDESRTNVKNAATNVVTNVVTNVESPVSCSALRHSEMVAPSPCPQNKSFTRNINKNDDSIAIQNIRKNVSDTNSLVAPSPCLQNLNRSFTRNIGKRKNVRISKSMNSSNNRSNNNNNTIDINNHNKGSNKNSNNTNKDSNKIDIKNDNNNITELVAPSPFVHKPNTSFTRSRRKDSDETDDKTGDMTTGEEINSNVAGLSEEILPINTAVGVTRGHLMKEDEGEEEMVEEEKDVEEVEEEKDVEDEEDEEVEEDDTNVEADVPGSAELFHPSIPNNTSAQNLVHDATTDRSTMEVENKGEIGVEKPSEDFPGKCSAGEGKQMEETDEVEHEECAQKSLEKHNECTPTSLEKQGMY